MSNSNLVEQYLKFDFAKNDNFQQFLKELQPPVPKEAMELVKRHWYKKFVNEEFVPNYDGTLPNLDDIGENEHTHDGKKCTDHHEHGNQQKQESKFKAALKRIAYSAENYLKMVFMMTNFWV